MTENGMTIHHKGKDYPIELTEHEANKLSDLTQVLEYAPSERYHRRSPGDMKEWAKGHKDRQQRVTEFQSQLKRLAALDPDQMYMVMGIIELIEFGDGTMGGANWALTFISDLSMSILSDGAAAVLERDPRRVLAELATEIFEYWDWMKLGIGMRERHPHLFPVSETKAAPKSPAARTRAKRQRARKAGRKAA